MRVLFVVVSAAILLPALCGCAQIVAQADAKTSTEAFKKCVADNKATPEFQMIAGRVWLFDGSDTAAKL